MREFIARYYPEKCKLKNIDNQCENTGIAVNICYGHFIY